MQATCDWRSLVSPTAPGLALWLDSGPAQPVRLKIDGKDRNLKLKEVARVGEWTHPETGQLVVFSRQDLEEIATNTNAYIGAIGGRLRGPRKHDGPWINGRQPLADDNLGYWLSFHVAGDSLYGVCEPGDAQVAELLGGRIRGVSLCLVPEERDSHGTVHRRVLEHVAFTPSPVIDGLQNFLPLARAGTGRTEAAGIPIFTLASSSERKLPMSEHVKRIAEKAGVKFEGDEAKAADAICARFEALAGEKATALSASATAEKAIAAKDQEVTALSAKVGTLEKDVATLSKDLAAREAADCDREVKEVVALAAKNGRPEAFDADAQKIVREQWTKSRPLAEQVLKLARTAATSTAKVEAAGVVKPADKAAAADARKVELETQRRNAIAMGCTVREDANGALIAKKPNGTEVVLVAAAK